MMIRRRRRLTSPVLRREREAAVKPLRRECRAISALPDDLWAFFLFSPRGLRVRLSARHSLRPLLSRGTLITHHPDAIRAAGTRKCARHCERSEAIHASALGAMDCFVASAFALRASADKPLLAMTTELLFDISNQKPAPTRQAGKQPATHLRTRRSLS